MNIQELLKKLDSMHEKEEQIKKQILKLQAEWDQLQEDKNLMETLIMHQANKQGRVDELLQGLKK